MRLIAGNLNNELMQNLLVETMAPCTRVRAAIAYASHDNLKLFEACETHMKPLEFYGRYDHTVPIAPPLLKWFLEKKSPNFDCKLVPDILHAKVIWWIDAGVYIGSANLTDRAWNSNIEAGIFLPNDELIESSMKSELSSFFEKINEASHPLTKEIYDEQDFLSKRRLHLERNDFEIEREFEKKRILPKNKGVVFLNAKGTVNQPLLEFEREWNSTLQVMRSVADRVSAPEIRPSWVSIKAPAGAQADQFLHAYYYHQVREGNVYPFDKHHLQNNKNPELALSKALDWWHKADFDYSKEKDTIDQRSQRLRELLASNRIAKLSKEELTDVVSRVYAMRDHASKMENRILGLPDQQQDNEVKIKRFGEWLWLQKSQENKTVLDLLNYVIWGGGSVATRIWNGFKSSQWCIPHIGPNSLGEIVG